MSFTQFGQTIGLAPGLLRAAADLGWTVPTPVQIEAMPAVLRGQDVQVQAQTGSGKTGAFALPLLQALQGLQTQMPQAPRQCWR